MKRLILILTAACLILSGCAASFDGISVGKGRGSVQEDFRTFEVRAVGLPAFLGPIIVSNFSVALAEKGLQPVSRDGDALVTVRYEQVSSSSGNPGIPQGEARFTARVVVEIRANGNDEISWAGSIERDHAIEAGEYMHTGRASIAMLEAFRAMLVGYPVRKEEGEA